MRPKCAQVGPRPQKVRPKMRPPPFEGPLWSDFQTLKNPSWRGVTLMEPSGFEPLTPCMPCRCSTNQVGLLLPKTPIST